MSVFCPTCGSCYKDVRAPVITVNGTVVCCDNWHWVWARRESQMRQNPDVLPLNDADRKWLRTQFIRVDD